MTIFSLTTAASNLFLPVSGKGKMAKLEWEQEYTDGKYLTGRFQRYFPVGGKGYRI